MPEGVELLEGTGWQVAISQNPITHRWHWITWEGKANFADPVFVAAWNRGLDQHEETREAAVEAAVNHALDRRAGIINIPMLDTPVVRP